MVEELIERLIESLAFKHGFDLNDDNFNDTPSRVSRMYEELLAGYKMDAAEILKTEFPAGDYDEMIVCKGIDFYSLCAHHMLPFFGKVAVGYIPGTGRKTTMINEGFGVQEIIGGPGKVVGLSKLARIVQMYARRFQVQERMTREIAVTLQEHLNPSGIGVVIYDSVHLCMTMRGVKQHTSTMDTSCLLGEFRDDQAVRQEFFSLIQRSKS